MGQPLKTYTFDCDARIEFDCEASSAEEASDLFKDALLRAGRSNGGMDITPDTYQPLEKDTPIIDDDPRGDR